MLVLAHSKNKNLFYQSLSPVTLCLLVGLFSAACVNAFAQPAVSTVTTVTTTMTTTTTTVVPVASPVVVSHALAIAAGHVISSREVKISYIIDQALAMPLEKEAADKAGESQVVKNKKKSSIKSVNQAANQISLKDQWLLVNESSDFQAHLAQVLVEIVVSAEAENFSIGQVDNEEMERWRKHLQEQTQGWAPWKTFEVQTDELSTILNRKLRAKNFLKFKMEASGVTVSEDEVKQYYEKNRVKFGNMPFDQFRQSIRDKLTQDQTQDRLKDWFDILKRKYRVRMLSNQQSKP